MSDLHEIDEVCSWIVCATALSSLVLTFVAVQSQQILLRWRSEQLVADMHSDFGIVSEWPGNAQNNQAEPVPIEVKMDLKYLRCKTR